MTACSRTGPPSRRRRQRAPHPDVRPAGGIRSARSEFRVRHPGEHRDERGNREAQEDERARDGVRRADQQEDRGADHRADRGHRDVEKPEVPRDAYADGTGAGSPEGHEGGESLGYLSLWRTVRASDS